ncbi:MAG: lipid-A-disaccharide synthase N-terminal domain-containing protein [Holophagales bacterium]|nr:lipid-A-disaccharide synthase N-terminal domain-containing protein [Holophagales bacterium]
MTDSSGFLQPYLGGALPWLYVDSYLWTVFGLLGNAIFSSRFLIQWLYSERRKQLLVPPIFWHLSFWGGTISMIYALHIDKLPVILSFGFLPFIYFRNLVLLRRGRPETPTPTGAV